MFWKREFSTSKNIIVKKKYFDLYLLLLLIALWINFISDEIYKILPQKERSNFFLHSYLQYEITNPLVLEGSLWLKKFISQIFFKLELESKNVLLGENVIQNLGFKFCKASFPVIRFFLENICPNLKLDTILSFWWI